jgi:hypothetical protein
MEQTDIYVNNISVQFHCHLQTAKQIWMNFAVEIDEKNFIAKIRLEG